MMCHAPQVGAVAGPKRFLPPVARHWILAATLAAVFVCQPLLWHCWHQAHLWAGTQNRAHRAIWHGCSGCPDAAWPHGACMSDSLLTLPIIAGVDWRDPAIVPMPLGDPKAVNITGLRIAMYTDNRHHVTDASKRPPPHAPLATALAEAGASAQKKTVRQCWSARQTWRITSRGRWARLSAPALAAGWHSGHSPPCCASALTR